MATLLIVNADDFGISEGVNRAVIEAYQRGLVTSTTIMVNMPAFEQAVQLVAGYPALGVGVHLNLTAGKPILPPSRVPTLVSRSGSLLRIDRLLAGLSLGRVNLREIEAELSAQVERAAEAGLTLTHLDSHHHVHTHPVLQPIVVRTATRYGIKAIRCPVELGPTEATRMVGILLRSPHSSPTAGETARELYLKAVVLSFLGKLLKLRARRAALRTTDSFRGLLLGKAYPREELHRLLLRLPSGSTELMSHPGYPDEQLRRLTSYSDGREQELAALLDPASLDAVKESGSRLASYKELVAAA